MYDALDPNSLGVKFVAIQTEAQPPYVWGIYTTRHKEDLPKLPSDMLILPVEQAKRLFDFKKLENIVKVKKE